jgi:hypothetical protein
MFGETGYAKWNEDRVSTPQSSLDPPPNKPAASRGGSGPPAFETNSHYNAGERRSGDRETASLVGIEILVNGRHSFSRLLSGDDVEFRLWVRYESVIEAPLVGIEIRAQDGVLLFSANNGPPHQPASRAEPGDTRCYAFRLRWNLGPGDWFVTFALARNQNEILDYRFAAIHLHAVEIRTNYGGLAYLDHTFEELMVDEP